MKGKLEFSQAGERDLVGIYEYYVRDAGKGVADRFLQATRQTLGRLLAASGTGARLDLGQANQADLRYSPLPTRFKKYVVIYRPMPDGIEVVRILHGARDLGSILATEADDEPDQ